MQKLASEAIRAWARDLGIARYGDEDAYESDHERIFAVLVDVAAAYVDELGEDRIDDELRAMAAGTVRAQSLGDVLGDAAGGGVAGMITMAVTGLQENLEYLAEQAGAKDDPR